MEKLELKDSSMTITEQQQKYIDIHLIREKFAYLTGEEILPSQQHNNNILIEDAKFTYSPPGKALENKQKQPKSMTNNKLKY